MIEGAYLVASGGHKAGQTLGEILNQQGTKTPRRFIYRAIFPKEKSLPFEKFSLVPWWFIKVLIAPE
jgi:hypothetical protein